MLARPRHPVRLGAIAVTAALLVACGGSDDATVTDTTETKVGDTYAIETLIDGQLVRSQTYRVYGLTEDFELADTDTGRLIQGVRLDLEEPAEAKASTANAADAAAYRAQVKARLQPILDAQHALTQRMLPGSKGELAARAAAELQDMDVNLMTVLADYSYAGLSAAQYVDFYQAVDEVAPFSTQDDAEGEIVRFFESIQGAALQAACGTSHGNDVACAGPQASAVAGRKQADFLAALTAHGLSWRQFLAHMAERGDTFATLQLRYHAWASQRAAPGDNDPFPAFLAAYLATGTPRAAPQSDDNTHGVVIDGVGSMRAPVWSPDWADSPQQSQNYVLAPQDTDPNHYRHGQYAEKTVEMTKVTGARLGKAVVAIFTLDVAYNADHPTLPGSWIPRLNVELFGKPGFSGTVTQLINAGTAEAPIPQVDLRFSVKDTYGQAWTDFRVHGTDGLSVLDVHIPYRVPIW